MLINSNSLHLFSTDTLTFFSTIYFSSVLKLQTNVHQRLPREVFCKKRCSYKLLKLHRETPVLGSLLINLDALTLLKRLQHRCFSVKFAKFLRTCILKNICERLLLVHQPISGQCSSFFQYSERQSIEAYLGHCQTSMMKLF